MLIDTSLLPLFLAAAIVVILAPGPDTLLVLSRSLTEGHGAGYVASLGVATGVMVHGLLAAFGVSALIAASPELFGALRIAGAAYLVFLGAKALKAAWSAWRNGDAFAPPPVRRTSVERAFVHALTTNLLNPKVILFFLAFLPQFVSPTAGPAPLQMLTLAAIYSAIGLVWLCIVARLAALAARELLAQRAFRAALECVTGIVFIGFAIRLFLTERKFA